MVKAIQYKNEPIQVRDIAYMVSGVDFFINMIYGEVLLMTTTDYATLKELLKWPEFHTQTDELPVLVNPTLVKKVNDHAVVFGNQQVLRLKEDYPTIMAALLAYELLGFGGRELGEAYYDVPSDYKYITFGADGDWYAVRFRDQDESTGPQTGTKPTTLTALKNLTYAP